jgi:hypothetical protein
LVGQVIRTVVSADESGCHVPDAAVHRWPENATALML